LNSCITIDEGEKYNPERLVYRSQFVVGPRPLTDFTSWKSVEIRDGVWLTLHPDLKWQQVRSGEKSLTLLGYILDPLHPGADDSAVVKELLPRLCSEAEPVESLQSVNRFGGRWILIVDNGTHVRLLNDALAQRQIYYTSSQVEGRTWCASQPGILATLLHLEFSKEAADFVETQKKAGQTEYWFPNDLTPYDGIKLLLPNHYLEWTSARQKRFWPCDNSGHLQMGEAAKAGAGLLRGMMSSAANRFPLEILISAGWDSRVVLAASKELKTGIRFFTFVTENSNVVDVDVPAKLLPKLGRTHEILRAPHSADAKFKELYLHNVSAAHEVWVPLAQALFGFCRPSALRVTGSGSETVRQQFRPPVSSGVTPEILARFAHAQNRFATDAFAGWLSAAPANRGFDVLDLFYWEQKCGQWLAIGQVEWDIVGESFAPFNCRELLAVLLSVKERYRVPPHYKLYRTLIKRLWPAVLSEPINPHKRHQIEFKGRSKKAKLKAYLKKVLPSRVLTFARKLRSC
jgi:hypothetical protein